MSDKHISVCLKHWNADKPCPYCTIAALEAIIDAAPHTEDCEATGEHFNPRPCNCWKSEARDPAAE